MGDDEVARPRGRPALREPCEPVVTRLPPRDIDRLLTLAKQHETTVSAVLRQLVHDRLGRVSVHK
jgi:hypothetical protein